MRCRRGWPWPAAHPVVKSILEAPGGRDRHSWPNRASALRLQAWAGELDQYLIKVSDQIPGHLDSCNADTTKLMSTAFSPLARAVQAVEAAKAMRVEPPATPPPQAEAESPAAAHLEHSGDFTDDLARGLGFVAKKKLVANLNKQAIQERDNTLRTALQPLPT